MNLSGWLEDLVPALKSMGVSVGGSSVHVSQLVVFAVVFLAFWGSVRLTTGMVRRRLVSDDGRTTLRGTLYTWGINASGWLVGMGTALHASGLMRLGDFLPWLRAALDFRVATLGETPLTVLTVLTGLLVIAASFWISDGLQRLIHHHAGARFREDEDQAGSIAVAERLVHYIVVLLGVAVALHTVGLNLSALFAAGAVFAVGFGFAMQNIAQNFVSGVIVLVERVIKPGDIIVVEGRVVKVVRMGIRSTVVRTRDDEDLIVPNGTLAQNTVANLTLLDRQLRIRIPVGVHYDTDLDRAIEVLNTAARAAPGRLPEVDPVVQLTGFGTSSIDFDVSVWTRAPWDSQGLRSRSLLSIWRHLRDAGIVIAYPQLDLHLDPKVVEVLDHPKREEIRGADRSA